MDYFYRVIAFGDKAVGAMTLLAARRDFRAGRIELSPVRESPMGEILSDLGHVNTRETPKTASF